MNEHESAGNYKSRWRRYKRNLRWKGTIRKMGADIGPGSNPTQCPWCGSVDTVPIESQPVPGYSRSPFRFTEYQCEQCGQRFVPGAIGGIAAEEPGPETFAHPDPMMDNEPGSVTFPENWGKQSAHGLTPCPNCGGDIQHRNESCRSCGGMGQRMDNIGISGRPQYEHEPCPACGGSGKGTGWYECQGCRQTWDDNNQALKAIMPGGVPCPKCGSDMFWRDSAGLGRMWPEGAWECSNQRCWHMMAPGEMAPDTYQDPDAPGDTYLPEHWGGRRTASEIEIDSWIMADQHDGTWMGPYCVVDIEDGPFGRFYKIRSDAEGNDASRNSGEEGVDWQYVDIPAAEARPA